MGVLAVSSRGPTIAEATRMVADEPVLWMMPRPLWAAYHQGRPPTEEEKAAAVDALLNEALTLVPEDRDDGGWDSFRYLAGVLFDVVLCDREEVVQIGARPHIPAALRKAVFERDGYRCADCDGWLNLSIDHVMPYSLGGPDVIENLVTRCVPCNSRKGTQ